MDNSPSQPSWAMAEDCGSSDVSWLTLSMRAVFSALSVYLDIQNK